MRLIDADKLIKFIENSKEAESDGGLVSYVANLCIRAVNMQETFITAEKSCWETLPWDVNDTDICENCGFAYEKNIYKRRFRYCPMCGACMLQGVVCAPSMRGSGNEATD